MNLKKLTYYQLRALADEIEDEIKMREEELVLLSRKRREEE